MFLTNLFADDGGIGRMVETRLDQVTRHHVIQASLIARSSRRFTLSSTACRSPVSAGATPADFQERGFRGFLMRFEEQRSSCSPRCRTFDSLGCLRCLRAWNHRRLCWICLLHHPSLVCCVHCPSARARDLCVV